MSTFRCKVCKTNTSSEWHIPSPILYAHENVVVFCDFCWSTFRCKVCKTKKSSEWHIHAYENEIAFCDFCWSKQQFAKKLYQMGLPPMIQGQIMQRFVKLDESQKIEGLEEMINAYRLMMIQKPCVCFNCGVRNTPLWRNGSNSCLIKGNVPFCNACGLKYNKQQFCQNCGYVYDKKSKNECCKNCSFYR